MVCRFVYRLFASVFLGEVLVPIFLICFCLAAGRCRDVFREMSNFLGKHGQREPLSSAASERATEKRLRALNYLKPRAVAAALAVGSRPVSKSAADEK